MDVAANGLPAHADVVVVGAGLAGLAATLHLQRQGYDVVVLEAGDAPGGRIRTDVVDGFRLDRGFQLFNPSYPEALRMFDYPALDLKGFERGALVSTAAGRIRLADPRAHPGWVVDALRANLGGPIGLLRFAKYAAECGVTDPARLADRPDVPIADALAEAGIPQRLQDVLIRPFLSGVFLEPDLATSRRFADLILRSFVRGTPAVPAMGMASLPNQLADSVSRLFTGTRVTRVGSGSVDTEHGSVRAGAIVIAVGPAQVASLLPGFTAPKTHACTTWYHCPDQPPGELSGGWPILTLDGDATGPVVNTAVMSHAAPSYSPPGKSLVASTALGMRGDVDEGVVRSQLGRMYGLDTSRWTPVAVYEVADALPDMSPPRRLRQPVTLNDGLFIAGDHRDTASIQGALVSGRRAARAVHAALVRS